MAKILVCDDDKEIVEAIEIYLTQDGHQVLEAYDGDRGSGDLEKRKCRSSDHGYHDAENGWNQGNFKNSREAQYSDHYSVCEIRGCGTRYLGLNIGADDYITKPFNPLELVARVKSHLRRYMQLGSTAIKESEAIYTVGGLAINDDLKEVTVDGEPVKLTPIEYNILLLLVKHQGKVFSIDQIYENIWNENAVGVDNTVAVHIRHIREKIEINPKEPRYLKVVWGVGYKIEKQ